jgi:aldehyde dehydrogenase (NAD+)
LTNFINGEFIKDNNLEKIKVLNPTTEEIICEVNQSTKEELDQAVECSRRAFDEWGRIPLDKRVNLFMKLADSLEQKIINFSILESIDNGKNLRDSYEDMKEVIRLIRFYGGFIDKVYGATLTSNVI